MPEMIDLPKDLLIYVCGHCGIALSQMEVAAEIAGKFVDYEERTTGDGSYALCQVCRGRVKRALEGDVEKAVELRQQMGREHL